MNGTNWRDFVDSIQEIEAYQKKVRKGYVKDRNKYTQSGPQKKGGAPFDVAPPKTRSKSAPPSFGAIGEEVEVSSFDTHDRLEPEIWEADMVRSEIRKKLIKVAMDFMEGLPVAVEVKDITLTGSLANYNWSNYSDVDLHIIVNFLDVDENLVLVKSFFDNARMRWNNNHNIRMKGYDVEIYVENEGESHKSSGVFSLMNDRWIKKPKKYRSTIDFPAAKLKAQDIEFQVNIISNLITAKKYDTALKNVERLKRKIKNMRRAGLESTHQEFSVENIAFKILRRNDTLEYLNDLKKRAYDDKMTVKEE
jgi:glycosyltransferase involved in cell wall biosynthesis